MSSEEYVRHQSNLLDIKKLDTSTPIVSAKHGYAGFLKNFDERKKVNFIIRGPETRGFLVEPRGHEQPSLIPGKYIATAWTGGNRVGGPWSFHVNAQKHSFMGSEYHWYLYYDPR